MGQARGSVETADFRKLLLQLTLPYLLTKYSKYSRRVPRNHYTLVSRVNKIETRSTEESSGDAVMQGRESCGPKA